MPVLTGDILTNDTLFEIRRCGAFDSIIMRAEHDSRTEQGFEGQLEKRPFSQSAENGRACTSCAICLLFSSECAEAAINKASAAKRSPT